MGFGFAFLVRRLQDFRRKAGLVAWVKCVPFGGYCVDNIGGDFDDIRLLFGLTIDTISSADLYENVCKRLCT